ncbi:MAG: 16S rRNA (uracil(1498)-N(3))-methyltransferase, partial [Treponema sp.]|nr:16S rRNA (uracil(1498)-N(3))-methyltransferase [Treponema sp.]
MASFPNADGIIRLYGKEYHYLVRVRRLKPGSVFDALLPDGRETQVTILSTVDGILIGQCLAATGESAANPAAAGAPLLPPIILFQGLPKGAKMDLIVRQAAEGGIHEVVPFESEYSAVKTKSAAAGNGPANAGGPPAVAGEKIKRWERIIKEARQQSGSVIPTTVKHPLPVERLLDYWAGLLKNRPRGLGILFHQEPWNPAGGPLAQGTFHDYLSGNPEFVVLAIGPEGGFAPGEAARFIGAGFKPLVMGSTILRTETAALYAAAAVRIILLESASWAPKTHHG